jgi:hypothetical protein
MSRTASASASGLQPQKKQDEKDDLPRRASLGEDALYTAIDNDIPLAAPLRPKSNEPGSLPAQPSNGPSQKKTPAAPAKSALRTKLNAQATPAPAPAKDSALAAPAGSETVLDDGKKKKKKKTALTKTVSIAKELEKVAQKDIPPTAVDGDGFTMVDKKLKYIEGGKSIDYLIVGSPTVGKSTFNETADILDLDFGPFNERALRSYRMFKPSGGRMINDLSIADEIVPEALAAGEKVFYVIRANDERTLELADAREGGIAPEFAEWMKGGTLVPDWLANAKKLGVPASNVILLEDDEYLTIDTLNRAIHKAPASGSKVKETADKKVGTDDEVEVVEQYQSALTELQQRLKEIAPDRADLIAATVGLEDLIKQMGVIKSVTEGAAARRG